MIAIVQGVFPSLVNAKDTIPPIPVSDSSLRDKEVGLTIAGFTLYGITLDSIVITAAKIAIEELFDTMTAWINNGGNPRFATDLNQYMANLGDIAAGAAISKLTNGFVCQPFSLEIRAALNRDFGPGTGSNRYYDVNTCTLSEIQGNVQEFLNGDFSQGGWPAWFKLTQVDENNPYGSYLKAQAAVSLNISNSKDIELTKLSWGSGFIGTKECVKPSMKSIIVEGGTDEEPGLAYHEEYVEDPDNCQQYGPEKTPGTVISGQVNKFFGAGVDQLTTAHEFDQLFSAVVNQLANKVFNRNGIFTSNRIAGSSGPSSGSGTSGNRGACTVSTNRASVGDQVTWTASAIIPGKNIKYTWHSSDPSIEDQTTSDTNLKVSYATSGEKRIEVTASADENDYTKNPDANGVYPTITKTYPLSCTEVVTISQYAPLTLTSCSVNPTQLQGKGSATWTATVKGGSGRINLIRWTGDDTGKYDGGDFHYTSGPFTGTKDASGINALNVTATKDYYWLKGSGCDSSGGITGSNNCTYENVARPGYKTAKISAVDADPTIAPLEASCSAQIYIYH